MSSPMAAFLCPPGFAGPRGLRAIAREGSAVTEAARFVGRSTRDRLARHDTPYAARSPQPGQAPVVLVPGFMAGDGSLSLMARHLRRRGHRTYRSAIHANVGCTRDATEALERRVEEIATKRGRPVSIVGHSLGGLLARGLAARRPDLIEGIVTLGSPLLAPGAAHSLLLLDLAVLVRLQRVGLGGLMGADCTSGECARLSWDEARAPLVAGTPFTSVFSRRDGIVDWRSCLDPQARTVEVRTSHLGMAFDPGVLDLVGDALAAARAQRDGELSRRASLQAVPDASAG
ncbi:esterase/lipase family protein [Nocardioides iriomotensis]|uniref:Alpha/beta hydrolase n=1 Tax=Nocardioides iriomotensis TaxID=715784 RepID=A0A4Q5J6B6_9ACTN|nr:alpha/beta fold hydrolase [Nocardioides iriomotensis]RYU14197.1 alpha/beta hydrolase [Nocardioides iriomotensis]